jgi:hypothetical protein
MKLFAIIAAIVIFKTSGDKCSRWSMEAIGAGASLEEAAEPPGERDA